MVKSIETASKSSRAASSKTSKGNAAKVSEPIQAKKTAQKATGKPSEAYREGSSYNAAVVALMTLGVGKMHQWTAIVPAMLKQMEGVKAFKAKEARNDNGLDWKARLIQNVKVVARKDKYGEPLRATGYEVRYTSADGAGIFQLKKTK